MYRSSVISVLAVVVLAFATARCDFSPTSPFEGFDGEQGATLNGQFRQTGVAGASQLRVLGSGYQAQTTSASESDQLTVVVLDADGNEIGSVEVVDGSFTLRGLPDSFSLVYVDENGNEVGDPMYFDGVKPNQEIDIVVEMVDGSVVLIEEKRTGIDHEGSSGVEIEGTVREIDFDPSDPMTGTLEVDGYEVNTSAGETSIRKGNRSLTLEDLDIGDLVHVRGIFEDEEENVVFAFEIKLQEEEEQDGDSSAPVCEEWDPDKPNHILVCHKGRTLSIAPEAWPGHYGHGDTCGPCDS